MGLKDFLLTLFQCSTLWLKYVKNSFNGRFEVTLNLNDVRYDDSLRFNRFRWNSLTIWILFGLLNKGKRFPTIFWQKLFCSQSFCRQCKLYQYSSTSNLVVAWKPPLELKMVNFRSSKLWIMPNLSITAGCKVYEICWFRNSFQLDSILVTVRPQKRIW